MRSVGVKVLKNKLSEYVRLAASGESVLVTDRDRIVAELGPPRIDRSSNAADALLADLVRSGVLRPPLICDGEVPRRAPVATVAELLNELGNDRDDR